MKNIVYVSEKEVLIDGVSYVSKIKEEIDQPGFKVGQWYVFNNTLFRVTAMSRDEIEYNDENGDDFFIVGSCKYTNSRPATPQEIEAHLSKVLTEKGFVKGATYISLGSGATVKIIKEPSFFYFELSDLMGISGIDPIIHDMVYNKGQFAEIIPDKKKLPKTREELKITLELFANAIQCDPEHTGRSADKFLDQYED